MEKKLKKILTQYNIDISDNQIAKLCKFVAMMKDYNKTHNITAITDDNDILYKHILDSLLPLEKILQIQENSTKNNIKPIKILDIGCGGGVPSIPLAISSQNLNITALDSVHKKTAFVELVKKEENIENINILTSRIEDVASKKEYRETFDIVTSRAVASLNILLEYSAPMLKNGGYIIAYKGSNYKEELQASQNAFNILNCELKEVFEYRIPEIDATRYILKIKKNSTIPTKYPRSQNKPRLQPL